jgi:Rrf2 family protein
MLSKTALLATRALVVIAKESPGRVISPRSIALRLNESPAYLAKVLRLLVRAGILRAERGVTGGVFLGRRPEEITLLHIVEACQGMIHGAYCERLDDSEPVCAFHQASVELEHAIVSVLGRWTLADLGKRPQPLGPLPRGVQCWMAASPTPIKALPETGTSRRDTTQ